MKTILYTAILLISVNISAQTLQYNIPEEVKNAYEYDITHLAYERIFDINSTYMDSIFIPEIVKDTIWNSFSAIFNSSLISERDSVIDIYCIHNENCWGENIQMITISIDNQTSWYNNWQNLTIETGNIYLDDLMSACNFELIDFYDDETALLKTYKYINLVALFDSLETFDGINSVLDVQSSCGHNSISYSKEADNSYFTFNMNFACGIMVCSNHYIWEFKVDDLFNVELIESQHLISDESELPLIPNCNITSIQEFDNNKQNLNFSIYPNPANEKFSISLDKKNKSEIQVLDISGKVVYQRNFSKEINISTEKFKEGIYFVKVKNNDNVIIKKLIVE